MPLFSVPLAVPDQSTVPGGAVESMMKSPNVPLKVEMPNTDCTKVTTLEENDSTVHPPPNRSTPVEAPVTPERPVKLMASP